MRKTIKRVSHGALRSVLILAGVGAFAYGTWKLTKPLRGTGNTPVSEVEKLADIARLDKSTLLNPNARETEIYGALVRLSQQGEPLARQEAIKYSKSAAKTLREGAANALGGFDDAETLALLSQLADDADANVRLQALRALGRKASPARRKLLAALAERTKILPAERVAAHASLAKMGGTPVEIEGAVATLIKLAMTEKDATVATRAAAEALTLAPRSPKVISMLHAMLEAGRNDAILATGVRHLAVSRDPWMLKHYRKYLDHRDPRLRMSIIQSLHFLCPDDRWTVLEGVILNDRDRSVAHAAILASRFMPGGDARALLQRLLAGGKLGPQEKTSAQAVLAELQTTSEVDPCLRYRERRE